VIRYGRRHPLRGLASKISHTLCPPRMIYESIFKSVKSSPLGCMVCVYDEQATIVNALKTTMSLVDYYVVIDKNGKTIEAIQDSGLDIDLEYRICPNLTLAESRNYALSLLKKAEWILIQDGDEFYSEQLADIPRTHPHTYYRTRKNLIYPDRTMPLYHSGYHSFLFHNNGTIKIPFPNDIPRVTGRATHLDKVMIWNYHHRRRPQPQTVHYTPTMGSLPVPLEAII